MTDNAAPSSTLARPVGEPSDDDLLARWQHSAEVVAALTTTEDDRAGDTPDTVDGDVDPGTDVDTPGEGAPPGRGRAGRLLSHLSQGRVLVGLLVVAALAAAGWFAYQDHTKGSAASDRVAAANAAKSDALALATYDYGHLDQFFADVKSFSTPGFGSTFNKGAQSLVKVLTQYKATSTGKLASYGVKTASGNRVTVLVVIDQTVANSASKTPSAQTEAFEYTMVHQGGRWLLDVAASVH